MRTITGIHRGAPAHWVGNAFPVRTLFSYERLGESLSPFLMLDHAGPYEFPPSEIVRGVGEHAHRGFETVTLVFEGEIEHRDSAGNSGHIGPGDVQWMTAAGGILHEESHSSEFSRRGGTLHVVQLWVNLPASSKMSRPAYQSLAARDIPSIDLPGTCGSLRVIAGEFAGHRGPAHTFSPLSIWDVSLRAESSWSAPIASGLTAGIALLGGTATINQRERVGMDDLVVFDRGDGEIIVDAETDTHLLVLGGEPLNEPIAGYGPFVMNTREEIEQAITALHRGEFGEISPAALRPTG